LEKEKKGKPITMAASYVRDVIGDKRGCIRDRTRVRVLVSIGINKHLETL
jgi:hypothetical protein